MNVRTKENINAYLFIFPYALFFVMFIAYMLFDGIKNSFYELSYMKTSFVGLENYKTLFSDEVFLQATGNTLVFVAVIVLIEIIIGLWIASTVFDMKPKFISFIRIGYYIPTIVSMVVMSIVWAFLLDPKGIINYFLKQTGLGSVNFLGDPRFALLTVIFVVFTANIGTTIILYIAAMSGISLEMLEASDIDGVTRFQKVIHIIIPIVRPTTVYILITNIVAVIRLFIAIQLLTGGGPMFSTTTIMYYLYLNAFKYNKMGIACAVGVIMFAIAFILSVPQLNKSIRAE